MLSDINKIYTAITIITVSALFVEILSIRATRLSIAKWFERTFYLVIIASICELIGVVGFVFGSEFRSIIKVAKALEMMVAPVIPIAMALCLTRENMKIHQIIPLALNAVIIFSSLFTGKIFYFSPDGVYHHGDYYHLYTIFYCASIFYMIAKVTVFALKNKIKDVTVLSLSFSVLIIGLVIQAIYPIIRIDWCTAAMASTLICLHYVTQDQKRAVDEYKKAVDVANKANMAKTVFMGRMSHDLRTPINGIMGMVQIAMKNKNDQSVVEDCLKKIDYSNRHLLSLINDILQMTSLESGAITLTREKFDLVDTFRQCNEMLTNSAKERGVRLLDDDFENIKYRKLMGSPVHVRQIYTNIISNAIKYNKIGGFVELKTAIIGESGDKVTYRFTISDTGLGMSDEFLKSIYDPFSREDDPNVSNRPGSGLGMSIVKELVTLMGGNISIISEKNVGSVITVDLPFEIDNSKEEENILASDIHSYEGKRVLLVEDNELNQEIALYMLKEKGFEVDACSNGKEALGKYLSSPLFHYNLILMDIMMPVMNGLDATKEIRASNRPDRFIPIIAMTANAYEEDKRECLKAGMDDHLAKPLEEKEMFKSINKFL